MSPELQAVAEVTASSLDEIADHVNAVNAHHSASVYAIVSVLIAKGIVTEQEFAQILTSAVAQVDQLAAKRRDEQ